MIDPEETDRKIHIRFDSYVDRAVILSFLLSGLVAALNLFDRFLGNG